MIRVGRTISIGLGIALLAAGLAGRALGADAQEVFDDLFGAELGEVRRTVTVDDDIALGWEMVRNAEMSVDAPELMALLCENACDLAGTVDLDEALFVTSMTFLADNNPAKASAAWDRLAAHWAGRYRKTKGLTQEYYGRQWLAAIRAQADQAAVQNDWVGVVSLLKRAMELAQKVDATQTPDIRAALAQADVRRIAHAEIELRLAKLQADPDNRSLRREILMLYLLAMDDPHAARTYVNPIETTPIETCLVLAQSPAEELEPETAGQLLAWYDEISEDAEYIDGLAMWDRQVAYGEQVLKDGTLDADAREAIAQVVAQAREELALAGMESLEGGRWTDVVEFVDLGVDRLEGTWSWDDKKKYLLTHQTNRSRLGLPVVVPGSYSLKLRLARLSGEGGLTFVLPVGRAAVALQVDDKGVTGLSSIDGKPADNNDTAKTDVDLPIEGVTSVEVSVQVEGGHADIRVKIDGRGCLTWQGEVSDLTAPPVWATDENGRVVIGSSGAQFAFETIEVRPVGDNAKRLR